MIVFDVIFALGLPVWLFVEELVRVHAGYSTGAVAATRKAREPIADRLAAIVGPRDHLADVACPGQVQEGTLSRTS